MTDDNKNLQDFISLSEASKSTGYHQDYLGFLCRQGKLKGFKIGRNWFITKSDLDEFLKTYKNGINEVVDESGNKIRVHVLKQESNLQIPNLAESDFVPASENLEVKKGVFELEASNKLNNLKVDVLKGLDARVEKISSTVANLENEINKIEIPVSNKFPDQLRYPINLKNNFSSNYPISSVDIPSSDPDSLNFDTTSALSKINIQKLYSSFTKFAPSNLSAILFASVIALTGLAGSWFIFSYFDFYGNEVSPIVYFPKGKESFNSRQGLQTSSSSPAVYFTKTETKVISQVLGFDQTKLYSLIDARLNKYLSEGKFIGPKGEVGIQGPQGFVSSNSAPISYYSSSYGSGSIFAATDLSAERAIFKNLNVTGGATLSSLTTSNINLGFAQGGVVFQGASGLAQDSLNYFYNASTTQLAIGTSTPNASAILELDSTSKGFLAPRMTVIERNAIVSPATGLLIFNTDDSQYNFFNGTSWLAVGSGGGGNGSVATGTLNSFAYYSSVNQLSPQNILFINGNRIGIGSTSPTALLTIQATGSPVSLFQISSTTGDSLLTVSNSGNLGLGVVNPAERLTVLNNTWLGFTNSSGSTAYKTLTVDAGNDLYLQYPESQSLFVRTTDGVTRLRVDAGGNIAVGKNSASARLDVVGTSMLFGSDNISNASRTDATIKQFQLLAPHYLNSQNPVFALGVNNDSVSNQLLIGGGLTASANALNTIAFYTSTSTTGGVGLERMRIDLNGNVGIGSTTPTQKLVVDGGYAQIGGLLINASTTSSGQLTSLSSSSAVYIGGGSNVCNGCGMDGAGIGVIGNTGFLPGSIDMFIAPANKVSTSSSPTFSLTVGDTFAKLINAYTRGNRVILNQDGLGTTGIGATTTPYATLSVVGSNVATTTLAIRPATSQTANVLDLYNNSGAMAMVVSNTGNVAIGTTTPAARLSVTGTNSIDPFNISSTSGASILRVTQAGNVGIGSSVPSSLLTLKTALLGTDQTNVFTLTDGGNVLRTALRASGIQQWWLNSGSGEVGSIAYTTPTGIPGISISGTDTNNRALILNQSSILTLGVSSSGGTPQQVFLNTLGNLGIGTSTPSQKLVVSGDARITGVLFDSSNASGTLGMVLQTTGTGTQWVATSSLGISSSLSGGVGGYVARWTSASGLSTGTLMDDGTVAGVNATSSTINFLVQGTGSNNPFQINSSTGTGLVTVLANGNVGIGTDTPISKLHLFSSSSYDMRLTDGSGNKKVTLGYSGSDNAGFIEGHNGLNVRTVLIRAAINSNVQGWFSSGLFGIGTSSPAAQLHIQSFPINNAITLIVQASSSQTSNLTQWRSGSNSVLSHVDISGNFGIGTTTTQTRLSVTGSSTVDPFNISSTSGSSILRVVQDGNVGINTTTPTQKLVVAGDVRITGALFDTNNASGTQGMVLQTTGTGTQWVATSSLVTSLGTFVQGGNSFGATALFGTNDNNPVNIETNGIVRATFDTNGRLGIGTTSPIATLTVMGTSSAPTINPFVVASSSGTQLFTITPSGNVGIGTANPTNPLDVFGRIQLNTNGSGNGLAFGNALVQIYRDSGANMIMQAFTDYVFTTNSSSFERMRITQAGNIGIGTSTPSQQLVVAGNARIAGALFDSSNASGTTGMILQTTGTGTQWVATSSLGISSSLSGGVGGYVARWTSASGLSTGTLMDDGTVAGVNATSSTINFLVQGTGSNNPFQINSSTGTGLVTVLANGNLGVGVTAPTGLLHVQKFLNNVDLLLAQGLNSGFKVNVNGEVVTLSGYGASDELAFGTNSSTERMRINSTGNVGIGTTTPSARVSVTGSSTIDPFDISSTSGTSLLRVTQAGNVGIGTTIPGSTLSVVSASTVASTTPIISVGTSTNGSLLTFNGLGRLGIGNTSPSAAIDINLNNLSSISSGVGLNISRSADVGINVLASGASTRGYINLTGSSSTWWLSSGSSGLQFINNSSINAAVNALMTSTGFGIGTTTISTRLSLTGSPTVDPFNISSTSGSTILRVTQAGNVGIGTTSPQTMLHVGSVANPGSVTIAKGYLCVDDNDTCSAANADGGIYSVTAATTGADVAENYPTYDIGIKPGDVVVADNSSPVHVVKASSTSSKILGVVSTKPGVLLNGYKAETFGAATLTPVALSGRVPVKVSNENGNIKIGDYLVASKKFNGYAMKATYSGDVIGVALENFEDAVPNSSGKVLVFMKIGYQVINNTFVLGENDGQIANATSSNGVLQAESFLINQKGSGNILQLQANDENRFLVASSGLVSILAKTVSETDNILTVSNNSTPLFTINAVGKATLSGHIQVGKDTAGTAIIKAGDNKTTVTFNTPYTTTPKVIVTVNGLPDFSYGVIEKTTNGFTIAATKEMAQDMSFDWFVVEQPEQTGSVSGINILNPSVIVPDPTPTPEVLPTPTLEGDVLATSTLQVEPTPTPTPEVAPTPNQSSSETPSGSGQAPTPEVVPAS